MSLTSPAGQPWTGPAWAHPSAFPAVYVPAPRAREASRLVPTLIVAAVIATVVLGGTALDGAIAAPSAGTVPIGGSITLTAAPGWVLVSQQGDTSSGIELRKADAILTAQVVPSFAGDPSTLVDAAETQVRGDVAQVDFGEVRTDTVSGHASAHVLFEATVTGSSGSGVVDGEIVAMDVGGTAVLFEVAAPQGRFDAVTGDMTAMLASVKAAQ